MSMRIQFNHFRYPVDHVTNVVFNCKVILSKIKDRLYNTKAKREKTDNAVNNNK